MFGLFTSIHLRSTLKQKEKVPGILYWRASTCILQSMHYMYDSPIHHFVSLVAVKSLPTTEYCKIKVCVNEHFFATVVVIRRLMKLTFEGVSHVFSRVSLDVMICIVAVACNRVMCQEGPEKLYTLHRSLIRFTWAINCSSTGWW